MVEWHQRVPPPPALTMVAQVRGGTRPILSGTLAAKLNDLPHSSVQLSASSPPFDYASDFAILLADGEETHPRFSGSVTEAHPAQGRLTIIAEGGLALAESRLGHLSISRVHPLEVVTALAEEEGQEVVVQGAKPPTPSEVFCVQCPISDITTDGALLVGRVRFSASDSDDAALLLSGLSAVAFQSVASCYVVASTLAEAQARGLAHIDVALDTLLLTNLYSFGATPDGHPLSYSRTRWRSRPARLDYVLVRGLSTGRSWLRAIGRMTGPLPVQQDDFDARWGLLVQPPPGRVQRGMAALRRASDPEESAAQRNQALWNALEFYAASTEVPRILDASELAEVKRAAATVGLAQNKLQRVNDVLAGVNNPPLMTRILASAERDGLPLNADDRSLLKRLRKGRNDTSHGRLLSGPEADDLRLGVSLTARLLLHAWYTETHGRLRDVPSSGSSARTGGR